MTPWVLDISQKMLFVSLLKISKDISVQIYIQEMSSYYQAHLLSPMLFLLSCLRRLGGQQTNIRSDTVFFLSYKPLLGKEKSHIF